MRTKRNKANAALVMLFFGLVCAVIPIDVVFNLSGGKLPGRPPHRRVGSMRLDEEIWNGSLTRKVERELVNVSTLARSVIGPYNEIVFRLVGRSPPSVRIGEEQWLSTPGRPKEIPLTRVESLIDENVEIISVVDKLLRRRNAHLVVALIPDRTRLHPEKVYVRDELPPTKSSYLARLTQRLRQRGVDAIDLTADMVALVQSGEKAVYSDDHHWTSRAAEAAARTIARAAPPPRSGSRPKQQYRMRWKKSEASTGSLLRLLSFREGSELERAFSDRADRVYPQQVTSRKKAPCAAYWTTSFGRYGSGEFYANEVRCPVQIHKGIGQGSSHGPRHGLGAVPDRSSSEAPFVVVWEIPEYHTITRGSIPPGYVRTLTRHLPRSADLD